MEEKSDRARREEEILAFWKENKIFEKTLEKEAPKGDFVFYEGPPTANAKPALHHLEARVFKDALPRYKTMRGYRVPRKAGWDTHGLPVELQIEKKLGLKSKKEIEQYGIERFNKECKESVFEYIGDWEKFTERIGYWVNFKDAYYTFDNSYIETLWSILNHVEKRGLLYKDYKVLPWCPRCGTALSSHELAQGYQDVKDLSLYVKFKIKAFPDAYFLAWTTTPWTLPGNVALAVGSEIDYVEAKVGGEIYVLAKDRLSLLTEPYKILAEHKGSEMVGMEYEPLYSFMEPTDKTFKIYPADFVTTTDGTGIVHTAVMYGQEDFELGTKVGLPKKHLVLPDGTFMKGTGWLEGRSVVDETLAVDILKDLQGRGLLFGKENHQHSYPFCWRCKTRLIYYARDSWYIAMSKLRDELVKENGKINWEPEYIKEGRFGEWLREVKDWAISRERYWGTPLPIWQNHDGSKRIIVDSLETLKKYSKKSGNAYFAMRHGEAIDNAKHVLDPKGDPENHLTEKGKKEAADAAQGLKGKNIDLILASPFIRTRETAEIVRKELGLPEEALIIEERLHEFNEGDDTLVRRRIGECMFDLERSQAGKNIMIISHGNPLWVLERMAALQVSDNFTEYEMFRTAEVKKIDFAPFPHNDNFELDLHRPYVDDIGLEKDGEEYRRVKEVMDVWFDSGSMPFAQDPKRILYPADFISEAIDQTRGWFYTLHAIGVLMGKGRAYKNVICLGHILDKEGKKMSKSVGNVVNPWEMIDKYGVDALRLWMYSVNQPGDSKNFDERTVDEIQKRVFNLLDNVYSFYELYRDKGLEAGGVPDSTNALDRWIIATSDKLSEEMTGKLDSYKLMEPVRMLREFVGELSTWYLRRSRDRIKDGDQEAKRTLYFVLKRLATLMAPFAPFAAEDLYRKLRNDDDPASVHLADWPEAKKSFLGGIFGKKDKILEEMEETRRIVSLALELRNKASIKVRQPLAKLEIKEALPPEYLEIVKDELNVKEILVNAAITEEVALDTTLTPELVEEGKVRDAIRAVQEWRKEQGLKPGERAEYPTNDEFFHAHKEEIGKA
ncbi:class I tRNA ligase family protein, partial [Candidatus Parcubacteria bacterium]|nr:class I tRNA ligase family protein [Candidatus Parcubacteria bacterium]